MSVKITYGQFGYLPAKIQEVQSQLSGFSGVLGFNLGLTSDHEMYFERHQFFKDMAWIRLKRDFETSEEESTQISICFRLSRIRNPFGFKAIDPEFMAFCKAVHDHRYKYKAEVGGDI